jgi:hypothetical protein
MGDRERSPARRTRAIALALGAVLASVGCSNDLGGPAHDGGGTGGADGGDGGEDARGGAAADGGIRDAAPGDGAAADASDSPDASVGPDAAPATVTISHSTDPAVIEPGHSISCNSGAPSFLHTDNSYWRVFDLPAFGIDGPFFVTSVGLGVDRAWSVDGFQPLDIRLYTLEGSFSLAHLTPIGAVSLALGDQSESLIEVPLSGPVAPAGSVLVLEIHTPSGIADGRGFFLGSNSLGQSGPSYLSAEECHLTEPTDLASVDSSFADVDWVLSVTGVHFP